MCIIVFCQEPARRPSEDTLKTCWDSNPDGAGLMYAHNNRLHVVKGLMSFDAFIAAWRQVPENVRVAAHFRIKSHGSICPALTHPFPIIREDESEESYALAVVHNGVLTGTGAVATNPNESDTSVFVRDVLSKLPPEWETSEGIVQLLAERIGYGNKMVFLRYDGAFVVLNRSAGEWDNGIWYSNSTYKRVRVYPTKRWQNNSTATSSTGTLGAYGGWDAEEGDRYFDGLNYKDRPPHYLPIFKAVTDQERELFGDGEKAINWDTMRGLWYRRTSKNHGVMIQKFDEETGQFIGHRFMNWRGWYDSPSAPLPDQISPWEARTRALAIVADLNRKAQEGKHEPKQEVLVLTNDDIDANDCKAVNDYLNAQQQDMSVTNPGP